MRNGRDFGGLRGRLAAFSRRLTETLDPYVALAYAQDGEDMVLRRLVGQQVDGFYVDVGAHDPFRFSNTCYFHRNGWRGINIDADPDAIAAFRRARPRDVNLCVGVSDTPGRMNFYRFNEPALNTFDAALASERTRMPAYRLLERIEVPVRRLDDILTEYVPPGQVIDMLSIDVEGLDAQVLMSNDWSRFRSRFLLVEALRIGFADLVAQPSYQLATSAGYVLVAKTANTLIFGLGGESSPA
jgi:FkbM family methyltransferase